MNFAEIYITEQDTVTDMQRKLGEALLQLYPKVKEIMDVSATACNINTGELKSGSRKGGLPIARAIAIHQIRKQFPSISKKKIGLMFGGRDHSTIIHAETMYQDMFDTDKAFRNKAKTIEKIIESDFSNFQL